MVIKKKICICREEINFENARTFGDAEISVQFILITFETCDKTCSKTEKSLVSTSSMGGKKR